MSINVSELIWAIINFAILLAVLIKFLYKPLVRMLDDRKNSIEESLRAAEDARKETELTKQSLQAEIVKARQQAAELVAAAEKASEEAKKEILAKAENDAKALIERAKAEIEREKADAIAQIKEEIGSMAIAAATKIIKGEMNPALQKELADKYIDEVGRVQ